MHDMTTLKQFQQRAGVHLQSFPVQIFLTIVLLHILVQLVLNIALPFESYSQSNNHDGYVYYRISLDPLPEEPAYTNKRYQRPLLSLIAWAFFPWNRELGFSVVNTLAVSVAVVYFYRIMGERDKTTALRLVFLCATVPYLFASAHMGLTEPLMIAGMLAGYYHAREEEFWKASVGYALAMLAKEIALLPVLAELLLQLRRKNVRSLIPLLASFGPVGLWYLLVGLRWGDLFWMLKGPEGQMGFGPAAIVNILRNPLNVESVPPVFFTVNQLANIGLLILIVAGLYVLRKDTRLVFWVGFSVFPLLFLGREVYGYNFDIGRQALPALLLIPALRSFRFLHDRRFYWSVLTILMVVSLFWTLYFAKYLVFYKFG
jgi:hypothetical protein